MKKLEKIVNSNFNIKDFEVKPETSEYVPDIDPVDFNEVGFDLTK